MVTMRAAARVMKGQGAGRIVVAGEMLELGPSGEELHRRSGEHIAKKGIGIVSGSLLYELTPYDPVVLTTSTALLSVVAFTAACMRLT